jgi:hypothetical protein
MAPDRRARRPAPAGPGKVTPSAATMLRIRRIAAQARAIPGFPKPSPRAAFSAIRCTAWRRGVCLAGYLTGGMPLPDEFRRLAASPRRTGPDSSIAMPRIPPITSLALSRNLSCCARVVGQRPGQGTPRPAISSGWKCLATGRQSAQVAPVRYLLDDSVQFDPGHLHALYSLTCHPSSAGRRRSTVRLSAAARAAAGRGRRSPGGGRRGRSRRRCRIPPG